MGACSTNIESETINEEPIEIIKHIQNDNEPCKYAVRQQ